MERWICQRRKEFWEKIKVLTIFYLKSWWFYTNNKVRQIRKSIGFKNGESLYFRWWYAAFFWNTSRQKELQRRAFSTNVIYHVNLKYSFASKTFGGYRNKNHCGVKTFENSSLTKKLGKPHTYRRGKVTHYSPKYAKVKN